MLDMIRRLLIAPATLLTLSLCLGACSSVTYQLDVAERLDGMQIAQLRADVEALCAIGPRPIENEDATAKTVAWLHTRLESMGLLVKEEPVSLRPQLGRLVAKVRRPDADPESEPLQLELPAYITTYGPRVLRGQSQRLRDEGWEVLGYSLQPETQADSDVVAPNLLVEIRGTTDPTSIIEIGAHYDTVPGSPGADDNSSGVAALLELARVLKDAEPAKTIRLCFFAAEEAGLVGSGVHVDNALERKEDIEAFLNLDSVGFASDAEDSQAAPVRIVLVTWMPSVGDFVTVIGNWSSGSLGNLFEDAADTYVPDLPLYSANRIGGFFQDGHRSDHAHYWEAGIPALFLTDTGEFRSDRYHMPYDTADTLDYDFLRKIAVATGATALELANR